MISSYKYKNGVFYEQRRCYCIKNIGMKFNLSKEKVDSLKDYVIQSLRHQIQYNEFWALKDINLTIKKGERVGILGLNGAGKSTLLKVIAGVFKPTEERWKNMEKLRRCWNWERDLKNNIRKRKYLSVWCNAWVYKTIY